MMPGKGRRLARIGLTVIAGALVFLGIWGYGVFFGPNHFEGSDQKTFTISRGQTFATIVDSLESQKLIRSRALFVFVARVLGGTTRMQVGRYVVSDGISNYALFVTLRDGRGIIPIQVTLPEGYRAATQARILARTLGIDSARYMALVNDPDYARKLGIPAASLDGYLMPETYTFGWQPDEHDVIERQVREFFTFYDDALRERTRELGWTMNQMMAMASIVEGEAMLDSERARIAGVYHNRLRRGMYLQADPTIQYILNSSPRRLLYSDLRLNNPYNTYRNRGLPPGPVNNPGKASIRAALYPEQHQYLFFVANRNGGHWFTKTYAEHQRYVREYRRLRAQEVEPGLE